MNEIFLHFIEENTHSSVLIFVFGGLFILSTYHFLLYLENGDRAYLLYSFYTATSLLAYLPIVDVATVKNISAYLGFNYITKDFFTWTYNCLYFFFFASFLKLKKVNKKWYYFITYSAGFIWFLALIIFILEYFFHLQRQTSFFRDLYLILVSALTLFSFVTLLKLRNPLKYYIIFGGVVLFITSMIGEDIVRGPLNFTYAMGNFIFFVGLFVENSAFSLALGHSQKIIQREKENYHLNLISQLKHNEILKDEINSGIQEKLKIENEKIRIQNEITELTLTILHAQLNPHFIFNALMSIKFYIQQNDAENAVNYLDKFSKLMRAILTASDQKSISLSEELQIMKWYMDIENLRFMNEIDFKISVKKDLDTENLQIPPMVLQPILENALWHGIATRADKKISIKVSEDAFSVFIAIEDNGIGREKAGISEVEKGRKSFGSQITRDLLKNFYGDRHHLQYFDLKDVQNNALGTKVVLTIQK